MTEGGATRLLRNGDFALVWWGGLLAMIGHTTMGIAMPIYVYLSTGSALATSLMFVANNLPRLLLSALAGVLVDRWPRQRTLVVTNLLLAAGCLPLLLAEVSSAAWVVYLVAGLQSSIFRFFEPAENALLPALVEREQLPSANALNSLNNNLARLIGPATGGFVIAFAGLAGIVVANLALCLTAAWLIGRVRNPAASAAPQPERSGAAAELGPVRRLLLEWREGFSAIRQSRITRLLVGVLALVSIGEGVFSVLITPFAIDVLGGGAIELGWLRSVQGIGGIVGGIAVAWFGNRLPTRTLLGVGALLFGLLDLAIFNYPKIMGGFAPALVLMVLVGVPGAAYGAGYATLLQTSVPERLLGRVYGAAVTGASFATILGIGLAGLLADRVGIVPVLNIQGYGYLAAGIIFLSVLPRRTLAA